MSQLKYNDKVFEVEVRKMDENTLNVVFINQSNFSDVVEWTNNADLSHIVVENIPDNTEEETTEEIYDGFTVLNAIVFLNPTPSDLWEGIRIVVALNKPN